MLKIEKEKVIRRSLDIFHLKIEKKFNEMSQNSSDISLLKLKDELKGKTVAKPNETAISEILKEHIQYFNKKVLIGERSDTSLQKYERAKELLMTFIQKEYKEKNICWTSINSPFIYNFKSFLNYESNFKGKIGIKNNSVVNI